MLDGGIDLKGDGVVGGSSSGGVLNSNDSTMDVRWDPYTLYYYLVPCVLFNITVVLIAYICGKSKFYCGINTLMGDCLVIIVIAVSVLNGYFTYSLYQQFRVMINQIIDWLVF